RKTEESTTASQRVSGLEAERVALERRREGQLDGVAEARNGWIDVTARHSAAMADLARIETERGEIADALRAREREGERGGEGGGGGWGGGRGSRPRLEGGDTWARLESGREGESKPEAWPRKCRIAPVARGSGSIPTRRPSPSSGASRWSWPSSSIIWRWS